MAFDSSGDGSTVANEINFAPVSASAVAIARRADPTFPTLTAKPPHLSSSFSISPFAAARSSSSSGGPRLKTLVRADGRVTEGMDTPTREEDDREEEEENGVEPPWRGVG